jgi:hypothetical protein
MTYRQLRKILQETEDHLLDDDVTVAVKNFEKEYFKVKSFQTIDIEDADILHDNHLVINIDMQG